MTLRSDIETATVASRAKTKKKKAKRLKAAGMFGDLWDYATGKKKKRSDREADKIDDILDQDPYAVPKDDEADA
jgi:hypothetical protein